MMLDEIIRDSGLIGKEIVSAREDGVERLLARLQPGTDGEGIIGRILHAVSHAAPGSPHRKQAMLMMLDVGHAALRNEHLSHHTLFGLLRTLNIMGHVFGRCREDLYVSADGIRAFLIEVERAISGKEPHERYWNNYFRLNERKAYIDRVVTQIDDDAAKDLIARDHYDRLVEVKGRDVSGMIAQDIKGEQNEVR